MEMSLCELLGVSISQRLTECVEDLNRDTDRNLHDNFHQEWNGITAVLNHMNGGIMRGFEYVKS
jgi:hypothetical protein